MGKCHKASVENEGRKLNSLSQNNPTAAVKSNLILRNKAVKARIERHGRILVMAFMADPAASLAACNLGANRVARVGPA